MRSRLQAWWVPAATGIAGLAAGLFLGGRDESPALTTLRDRPADIAVVATQGALTTEDIRRVVREELAAQRPAVPDAPGDSRPPSPTSKQAAAGSQARSVLETAIAKRQWAETDADAMRDVFDQLSPDQQAEILQQYAQAVNQGRLVPQTDRMPF